jgi:hypothetical protein
LIGANAKPTMRQSAIRCSAAAHDDMIECTNAAC